jgi:hypothetical protein
MVAADLPTYFSSECIPAASDPESIPRSRRSTDRSCLRRDSGLLPCRNRYTRLHEQATLLSMRGSTDGHRDLAFAPRRSSVRTLPRTEPPRRYRPCWRPGSVRELPPRGLRPPQPRSTRSRLLPGVPEGATSELQTLPTRDGTVGANPEELRRVRSPTPRRATPAQALLLDTLPCPGTPRTAGYVTRQGSLSRVLLVTQPHSVLGVVRVQIVRVALFIFGESDNWPRRQR